MLRATTACSLFISHLASWLRTRFSEPTFQPGAANHWKKTVFRDFPTFSRICIFFLLLLSLLLFSLLIFLPLPCSAFHLSIFSEVSFLNFLRKALTNLNSYQLLNKLPKLETELWSGIRWSGIRHKTKIHMTLFQSHCLESFVKADLLCALDSCRLRSKLRLLTRRKKPSKQRLETRNRRRRKRTSKVR